MIQVGLILFYYKYEPLFLFLQEIHKISCINSFIHEYIISGLLVVKVMISVFHLINNT